MLPLHSAFPPTNLDEHTEHVSVPRFLHHVHHPVMTSFSGNPSDNKHTFPPRPYRPRRRLSHPPTPSAGRERSAQEDGDFIKRAFDNLSLDPQSSRSSSADHAAPAASTSTRENADEDATTWENADSVPAQYPTGSRMSIASSSSQPYSSLSGVTHIDHASIHSSYPLLPDRKDLSASPPSAVSRRRRALRDVSPDNQRLNSENNQGSSRPPYDAFRSDQSGYLGHKTASERRSAFNSSQPNLSLQSIPTGYPQDYGTWSNPFAEEPRDRHQLPLRRSSTISGYSVNTSDWNSLRRGSLASLENASPSSATHNEYNTDTPAHLRSRNATLSSGNGQTPASAYAKMARSQQGPTSLRWEAWATAYRESLLQDTRSSQSSSYLPHRAVQYLVRYPSITEETTASISERHNHFYPLRRQFLPRAGSRSESNRILVLELCHALEEYERALGTLCRLAHSISPDALLASLSPSMISTPTSAAPISPTEADVDAAGSPASRFGGRVSANIDKVQLERLAGEVDSLVREIVEAVPAFSYSLSQGNYGPLPLPINNQHSMATDITIQQYLEQAHVLQALYPNLPSRPTAHREYTIPTSTCSRAIPDLEQEGMDMQTWWPNRLRLDLREGLLMDDVEDSPNISLQGSSVLPPTPHRQDPSGAELPIGSSTSRLVGPEVGETGTQGEAVGRNRNVELLAEGRRRWTEYLQGRQ